MNNTEHAFLCILAHLPSDHVAMAAVDIDEFLAFASFHRIRSVTPRLLGRRIWLVSNTGSRVCPTGRPANMLRLLGDR